MGNDTGPTPLQIRRNGPGPHGGRGVCGARAGPGPFDELRRGAISGHPEVVLRAVLSRGVDTGDSVERRFLSHGARKLWRFARIRPLRILPVVRHFTATHAADSPILVHGTTPPHIFFGRESSVATSEPTHQSTSIVRWRQGTLTKIRFTEMCGLGPGSRRRRCSGFSGRRGIGCSWRR